MNTWRVSDHSWSAPNHVLSGRGAFDYPGRWNTKGVHCCYTAENIETAVAEKGFYAIIQKLELFLKEKDARQKKHLRNQLENASYICSEIKISDSVEILNFTDKDVLASHLLAAKMKSRTIEECRYSPYQLLDQNWTQVFGEYLANSGVKAARFPSARSDSGSTIIAFSTNMQPGEMSVSSSFQINLKPIPVRGSSWQKSPKLDQISYSFEKTSHHAEVKIFEIPGP